MKRLGRIALIVVGLATPTAVPLYLIWRQYARVAREHGAAPAEFMALIRNEQARGYARSEAYARALAKLAGARRAVDEALSSSFQTTKQSAWNEIDVTSFGAERGDAGLVTTIIKSRLVTT